MYNYKPPHTQHGRILNRHLRGRPKFSLWQRLKSRLVKLVPFVVLGGLAALGFFVAKMLGLV